MGSSDARQNAPKAPRQEDGKFFYVVEERSWGRTSSWLVRGVSLTDAKRNYGWTRQMHTTRSVHRASVAEVEELSARA